MQNFQQVLRFHESCLNLQYSTVFSGALHLFLGGTRTTPILKIAKTYRTFSNYRIDIFYTTNERCRQLQELPEAASAEQSRRQPGIVGDQGSPLHPDWAQPCWHSSGKISVL
jgi:acyl-coenzyme A synthetase/AMP-(fatty) acid ligase